MLNKLINYKLDLDDIDYLITGLVISMCLFFMEAMYFIFSTGQQLNIHSFEVISLFSIQLVCIIGCVKILNIRLMNWICKHC